MVAIERIVPTAVARMLIAAGLLVGPLTALSVANPMSQTENFYDRPGSDYHSYNSGGFSQCATSCATVAECRAYTYVISTHICWMKSSVPARKASRCCISGVKIMGAQEPGFDRPGSDIGPGHTVNTSSQCESDCRTNASCRAYTFVKPGIQGANARCWLKHAEPAKVPNSCCVSGTKLVAGPPVRIKRE